MPKIGIALTETHYSETQVGPIDAAVETEVASVLTQLGFRVIDADNANLADQGVDQILKGEAFSEFGAHAGNMITCTARAEIKLTDRKTGDIMLADKVTTRAADLSENIAGKTALQKAGHELALRLAQYYLDQAATQPVN